MSYMRRDAIEERARELRIKTGLNGIPVRAELIATRLGISVKSEPLSEDVSGALMRRGGVAVIAVNGNHSTTRKTFSLAHELGHYVLHQDDEVFLDKAIMRRDAISARGDDWKEIQANQFAASLLMPKAELEQEFDKQLLVTRDQKSLIQTLAKKFAVSPRAMELRLVNLAIVSVSDEE